MRAHLSVQTGRATWLPARRDRLVTRVIFPTVLVVLGVMGCSDLSGLAGGKQPLPSGIPDQATLHTRGGALALYNTARCVFEECATSSDPGAVTGSTTGASTFVQYVFYSGLLTDELQSGDLGGTNALDYLEGRRLEDLSQTVFPIDARQLPVAFSNGGHGNTYGLLQQVRNYAGLAIDALAQYDTVDSPALRGYLYALQGYTELLLADLYCSGVPLSVLQSQGDYDYQPGSTTQQVYRAAIAKFDTALTLSADSATVLNMARVGKGRAYLALAKYDSAAAAVDSVPTNFAYQFYSNWNATPDGVAGGSFSEDRYPATMADSEGVNGLPYLSSGDPRTAGESWGSNKFGWPQYAPVKYGGAALSGTNIYRPLTVASGIEARLIQAEAEYHGIATGMGNWLSELNTLRQTAPVPGFGVPLPDPLPPLNDPGSTGGRVKLLFHERAFWLYMTGERQGDLRRLIRNYGYDQSQVYPSGAYPLFGAFSIYGADVNFPVPDQERANPLFTGCLSRGA